MADYTSVFKNALLELSLTVLGKLIVLMFFAPSTTWDMFLLNSVSETKSWVLDYLRRLLILYLTMLLGLILSPFLEPSLYYHGLKALPATTTSTLSAHLYCLRSSLHPRPPLPDFFPPS